MAEVTGVGLGLRVELGRELLEHELPEIDWVEIHPENYMRRGGRFETLLRQARERWPVATHGLSLCFGSTEPFDPVFLEALRRFLADVETPWHSDHMCFGGADGIFAHDLLPMPFHEESLTTIAQRIDEVRDALSVPLAFENVSYYAQSPESEVDEAEFTAELLEQADCRLLLDVNNVYVNSKNHGFDPYAWIDRIPPERVVQIHVAGHWVRDDGFRIDTHAEDVPDPVFDLLGHTLRRTGPKPVLLERDGNYPPLEVLLGQLRRVRAIYDASCSAAG